MGNNSEELRGLYRNFARTAAGDWRWGYDLLPDEKEVFDREITSGPVLDAGCGVGRSFPYFESRGFDVVGLDAVPEMLERAQEQNPLADLVKGELADIGRLFTEDRFAAVVCLLNTVAGLVEEDERRSFMRGVARVLKPDGVFCVDSVFGDMSIAMREGHEVVVDNRSRGGGFGSIFTEELGGEKIRCYQYYLSEQEFAGLLADAGFRFEFVTVRAEQSAEECFELTMAVCRLQ
jgi:SAM-dependent methyltransferase